MTSPATATLRRVIRSVAKADAVTADDRELLRRFARSGDQSAFAALVSRHTPMVLGVCRRALPTVQDAEDATQATFLVLARKAAGGRWQPSVANWLYATARRVARNARVAAQRRARREAKAAVPEFRQPVDRMTGRELLAALDEELERLPARYREPLVLCYLEGLTRDEAAARLGVPSATLRTRLDRGRKRLHDALTRGGCALGAGLLALAATSPAGASPPRLAQAVLAAATGNPSPAVATLAQGVAVNGVLKKSAAAALALAAALLVSGGVVSGEWSATSSPPTAPRLTSHHSPLTGAAPASQGTTVSGRVLAPDGKPLAGAKLLLVGKGNRPAELGTSGADGRFSVPLPKDWNGGYLVARAEDVGIDFVQLSDATLKSGVELRTVADHPVRGRVVDTEGKPVAQAWVRVTRIGTSGANSLDPILAEWKKLTSFSATPRGDKCLWEGTASLWSTTTDADGRFELHGLGAERLAALHIGGTGVSEIEVFVANRAGFNPKEYNAAVVKNVRDDVMKGYMASANPRWRLYGPELAPVVEREKLIRGRVTDRDTGRPRAGVQVLLTRSRSDLLTVNRSARTDQDGRYEIHGARKANGYMVEVAADTREGYMQCQGWADDTNGYEPVTIDLGVKKGVIVTGRILDKGTGKPVQGYAMIGVPQGNPSVKDYPEFGSSGWFPFQQTDSAGRFRVVAIPGPVLLMAGPNNNADLQKYKPPVADPKYPQFFQKFGDHTAYILPGGAITPLQGRACKVLEIPPGATVVEQDMELVPVK